MIKITVDTREPLDKIKPLVDKMLIGPRFEDIKVKYKKLDYGDYYIENGDFNLIIQRKSIGDYVGSYGGLPEQFLHLKLIAQRQALLIENHYISKVGSGDMWLDRGQGFEEVMKIQTHIRMLTRLHDEGIWVYYTNNLFETLLTIFYIAEFLPMLEHRDSAGKLPVDDIFLCMPGIGATTLNSLKAEYITPMDALAGIKSWAKKKVRDGLNSWTKKG